MIEIIDLPFAYASTEPYDQVYADERERFANEYGIEVVPCRREGTTTDGGWPSVTLRGDALAVVRCLIDVWGDDGDPDRWFFLDALKSIRQVA